MTQKQPYVLAMNGGSSSIKFALYRMGDPPKRQLHGKVDRIGLRGTTLTFDDPVHNRQDSRGIGDFDHRSAATFLIDWARRAGRSRFDRGGRPPRSQRRSPL